MAMNRSLHPHAKLVIEGRRERTDVDRRLRKDGRMHYRRACERRETDFICQGRGERKSRKNTINKESGTIKKHLGKRAALLISLTNA